MKLNEYLTEIEPFGHLKCMALFVMHIAKEISLTCEIKRRQSVSLDDPLKA